MPSIQIDVCIGREQADYSETRQRQLGREVLFKRTAGNATLSELNGTSEPYTYDPKYYKEDAELWLVGSIG